MPHTDAETPPPGKFSGGKSSPSSAETTFRELDEVFLQTQTKIWVGEVLQTRLNEQENIAEMLSDGELLFEVSRVIWEMVLTRRMELGHLKPFKCDPFASRKHSGRYTPYCNVDSFLKVCKILGLSGIDLFSPSDVVEQKNTRKVCMCIRLLSKKAKSKCLNVPDFDIVTRTASMPTDMVGFIRRSLELSQCSSSDSVTFKSPHSVSTTKIRYRHFLGASANSVSSEDIDYTDINVVHSNTSRVCLKDVSYEDYQQDSPILCKHSDAFEPNTNLDLIRESVSDEDFWESNILEPNCTPQFGTSSTMNYENSSDETEGITHSCASNLCSYETNQMTGLKNGLRGKSQDEYLELSSVSSTKSIVGPLRLEFRDEHDSRDSFDDIQFSEIVTSEVGHPKELDMNEELGGDDGEDRLIWSGQSDEDRVLLTEVNTSNAVDSRIYSEVMQNDGSYLSSSVLKVISSQVPSKSEEHLPQSIVTTCPAPFSESKSCTETTYSVSSAGNRFGHATNIDNVAFDSSKTRFDMVFAEETKSTSELILINGNNGSQEQERKCGHVDAGEKQGEVNGCYTGKECDFVAPQQRNKSSCGSDNQHEENAGHRAQKHVSHLDANQGNTNSGKSNAMTTQHHNDQDKKQPFKPADIKPQKRTMIKFIVRGSAVLSVMLLLLRLRKSSTGKVQEFDPSFPVENNQKQISNVSCLPAQKRRINGVEKGIYPAEKLKLEK